MSQIILRHISLGNSEKGIQLIIEFRFLRSASVFDEQTSYRLFLSSLLHPTKCDVNTLAKSEQVKRFCVKEYYLKYYLKIKCMHATLVQIGFNKFRCACTQADSGFPHDGESSASIFEDN